MSREDELREKFQEVRNELWEIETAKTLEKNGLFVGKFFKFKNSYGGNDPNQQWWLYISVRRMDDVGTLFGFSFETDFQKKIVIDTEKYISTSILSVEISKDEFWKAFDIMFDEIRKLAYG